MGRQGSAVQGCPASTSLAWRPASGTHFAQGHSKLLCASPGLPSGPGVAGRQRAGDAAGGGMPSGRGGFRPLRFMPALLRCRAGKWVGRG